MSETIANYTHEEVLLNRPDLLTKQYELEDEAANIARETIAKAIEAQGAAEGSPTVRRAVSNMVSATAKEIEEFIEEQKTVKRKNIGLKYIQLVEPEALAFLTMRSCLNQLVEPKNDSIVKMTRACMSLARRVRDAVEYEMFAQANPGLVKKMERQLDRTGSESHRVAVLRAGMRSADFDRLDWEERELLAVGFILIRCAADGSGLFEHNVVRQGKTQIGLLQPTDALMELLADADANDPILAPFRYPMIVPPRPWTDCYDGGYLNKELNSLRLVRVHRKATQAVLDAADMADVLDAVNVIQATPWKINGQILDILEAMHNGALRAPAVAGGDAPELPEKSWDDETEEPDPDVLSEWKERARDAYQKRATWTSKRMVQQQQLALAHRFREETLYFPHTLDFRGRVYPEAGLGAVNPQGNDIGKALLLFARGKPLTDEGVDWLCIHLANCWGNDKVALADRVLWTQMNMTDILSYAADPMMNTGWLKADKPFGFLAACLEMAGYQNDPEGFLSHLPIAVDGSCSGLQHFGAMMRCEKTADAVNLRQNDDKPADVYTVVLNRVSELVKARVAGGDSVAQEWIQRLSRNIVKQPVMTTPYGVSARGIVGQIADNSRKLISKGQMEPFETVTDYEAAIWLAPIVSEAIASEVAAARRAMDWLAEVANTTGGSNLPVHWTTPVGFLAIQDYRKSTGRQVKVAWGGKRYDLKLSINTSNIAKTKQVSGLAPNFVHSLDAAHLMVTANNAYDHGIHDFAMIHDSFGCHASDVPLLGAVLRECFIAMYSDDVLRDFYDQLRQQVPPDVFEKIPTPPSTGNFDIEAVRDSSYFFA